MLKEEPEISSQIDAFEKKVPPTGGEQESYPHAYCGGRFHSLSMLCLQCSLPGAGGRYNFCGSHILHSSLCRE